MKNDKNPRELTHESIQWIPKKYYTQIDKENERLRLEHQDTIDLFVPKIKTLEAEIISLQEENRKLKAKLWVANDSQLRTYDGMSQKADDYDEMKKENEEFKNKLETKQTECDDWYAKSVEDYNTITSLRESLKLAVEALEFVKIRLDGMELTSFPINVRELDGTISTERPKSNAGHAYDKTKEALATIKAKHGEL
jgi:predicted RNase H-like nuclease (RuvC/YqgF family)